MKIFAISANGEMYQIGENNDEKQWHSFDAKVAEYIKNFKVGEEVDVKAEQRGGSWCITFIGKPGSKPQDSGSSLTDTSKDVHAPDEKKYEKSPDVNQSIKRQAIAHATSRVCAGLSSASLTSDNVIDTMDKVYKKFQELVG